MICDSTGKILLPMLVTRGSTGSGYCSNARHKCCVCVLNKCDSDVWCLCGWAAKVLQDQLAAQSHATLSHKWQAMLDCILDKPGVQRFAHMFPHQPTVAVLEAARTGQDRRAVSRDIGICHSACFVKWLWFYLRLCASMSEPQTFHIPCWMATVDVSAHCLSVLTSLDPLQDTEGCFCEGRWTQRWTHGSSLGAHVMSNNAIFMTAKRNRYRNTQVCACYGLPSTEFAVVTLPSIHMLQVLLVLEHLLCTYVYLLR